MEKDKEYQEMQEKLMKIENALYDLCEGLRDLSEKIADRFRE